MSNLTPTIVRLPKEDLERYKRVATKSGTSFSALVREALDESFPQIVAPKQKKRKKMSFFDIGKIAVKAGVRDGSVNHDKYIYKRDW